MRQTVKWLVGAVMAAVLFCGVTVRAQEAAKPAAPPAAKSEMGDLMKQIKDAEKAVLEKDADLKAAVQDLDKQMAEKMADKEKAKDPEVRKAMMELRKQRQEKMAAASPELAELYKKLGDMRAAMRGPKGAKVPGEGKKAEGKKAEGKKAEKTE